jgi:hypothetical protein
MAGKENKKRGEQTGREEVPVVHLRSVLGNLNTCFGLLALEICALQLHLCKHV